MLIYSFLCNTINMADKFFSVLSEAYLWSSACTILFCFVFFINIITTAKLCMLLSAIRLHLQKQYSHLFTLTRHNHILCSIASNNNKKILNSSCNYILKSCLCDWIYTTESSMAVFSLEIYMMAKLVGFKPSELLWIHIII